MLYINDFALYYFIIKKIKVQVTIFIRFSNIWSFDNNEVFDGWNLETILLDTIWGGILFSLTTYFYRSLYLFKRINDKIVNLKASNK